MSIHRNKQFYPDIIQDFEVLPKSLEVRGNKCIGAKKYQRDIMISLSHNHGTNENNVGYTDIMLTSEQAKDLVRFLNNIIENQELNF